MVDFILQFLYKFFYQNYVKRLNETASLNLKVKDVKINVVCKITKGLNYIYSIYIDITNI